MIKVSFKVPYNLLYVTFLEEVLKDQEINLANLHKTSRLWKYRKAVSLQTFHLCFQEKVQQEKDAEGQCQLLRIYFKQVFCKHGDFLGIHA